MSSALLLPSHLFRDDEFIPVETSFEYLQQRLQNLSGSCTMHISPALINLLFPEAEGLSEGTRKGIQIENKIRQDRYDRTQEYALQRAGQMTLGTVRDALLSVHDNSKKLFLLYPDGTRESIVWIESYRGIYEEVCFAHTHCPMTITVKDMLDKIFEVIAGSPLSGYKGGDYYMTSDTPCWGSRTGVSSHLMVVGVKEAQDSVEFQLKAQSLTKRSSK